MHELYTCHCTSLIISAAIIAIMYIPFYYWAKQAESDLRNLRPAPMNNFLSVKEQIALDLLKEVPPTTIWGVSIAVPLRDFNVQKFRTLVCQLKTGAHESPAVMKSILGQKTFDLLVSL